MSIGFPAAFLSPKTRPRRGSVDDSEHNVIREARTMVRETRAVRCGQKSLAQRLLSRVLPFMS